MMIFKLTPTDVESDHWNGSTYKGRVIDEQRVDRFGQALKEAYRIAHRPE